MEGIHGAVQEGNEGEVARLLDGDPTMLERRDNKGETPLVVAAEHGQLEVARLLVQRGANINAPVRFWRRTALHYAARAGHVWVASCLLDIGAETNSRDNWRMTPLMLACENGHMGVVRMLVMHTRAQSGAQGLEQRDLNGKTALRCAAQEGHGEVVAFLLCNGAQASTRDNDNVTPLMSACDDGHLDVVRMLVQHTGWGGLDARDEIHGWTALHRAAFWGRAEVVRFLLAGADPTITDNKGRTAHELAQEDEEEEYVDMHEALRARRSRCVAVFKVSEPTCGGPCGDLSLVWTRQHDQSIAHLQPLSYTLPLIHLPARSLVTLVWQWWEGELERRYVLSRAMCLHKAYTTQRDLPTSQVPTYLEARLAAGHAVPVVEVVVWAQSEGQQAEQAGESGKRKAAGESSEAQGAEAGEEEQRHAVLDYVVTGLNEELIRELLDGFDCKIYSCFGEG
jgi:ankyrin repeat protein